MYLHPMLDSDSGELECFFFSSSRLSFVMKSCKMCSAFKCLLHTYTRFQIKVPEGGRRFELPAIVHHYSYRFAYSIW